MSIKKLFQSTEKNRNYLSDTTQQEAFKSIESADNLEQINELQQTYIPGINYKNPASFAKFGSAYLYYKSSLERILEFYPYDGSDAEKNAYHNKSLPIDKYIYDNLYPRTTGYIQTCAEGWGDQSSISGGYGVPATNEYVTFFGGPGTGSFASGSNVTGMLPDESTSQFQYSNIYDTNIYTNAGLPSDYASGSRESNLKSDFDTGVTVEFWLQTGSLNAPDDNASAVNAIDTTGVVADGGDCTITITIPAANSGDTTGGAGAITVPLDASETTGTPAAANQIGIGILGESDASAATLIKRAINNTSNSRIIPASAGSRGTAGVSGITATEGSSNTQLTLTMDTAGVIGNVAAALANVTGPTIVDVTDFTGGGNPGVPSDIMVAKSADVESLISSSDVYFPSQKVRYGFGMGVQSSSYKTYEIDADGATVAPFSLYSSSISDTLSSEMSNFTGSTIITNMHADLTSDQTDIPMQGPFTEKFVGGRQHRHIELNQSRSSDDSLSMANNFNGLDTRADRPEGFRIQMGYEFTGSNTGSPWKASPGHLQVVSPQYPELDTAPGTTNLFERPKANIPREEYAKRPVNIKNILMTTASLSQSLSGPLEHNRIGNYSKNYEVIQTAGRTQNDPFFNDQTFDCALFPKTTATRGRFLGSASPNAKSMLFDGSDDYI